jgi:hypothetical protein
MFKRPIAKVAEHNNRPLPTGGSVAGQGHRRAGLRIAFVVDVLMPGLAHAFVATVALISAASGPDVSFPRHGSAHLSASLPSAMPTVPQPGGADRAISDAIDDDGWSQVRIEQRLIIRIAPGMGREMPLPGPPPMPYNGAPRLRRGPNCVPMNLIGATAATSSDRQIVLLLRDRRQLVANLEKSCSARDFYVGFYAERSSDGMLCARRDMIHSRAGATCGITRLQEIGR